MRVLIDTHLLILAASAPERLSQRATQIITDESVEAYFSIASIWEVAIKSGLHRPDSSVDSRLLRRGLLRAGFDELVIHGDHASAVAELEVIHRDPFDRMLIAQAGHEGMDLITSDPIVARYPGRIELV